MANVGTKLFFSTSAYNGVSVEPLAVHSERDGFRFFLLFFLFNATAEEMKASFVAFDTQTHIHARHSRQTHFFRCESQFSFCSTELAAGTNESNKT